jgi:uncharacterized protein YqgC (DUF456 family)
MKSKMSLKKRILIAIPTVTLILVFLIFSWYYLPKSIFTLVLICFLLMAFAFDFFAKKYEELKKRGSQGRR